MAEGAKRLFVVSVFIGDFFSTLWWIYNSALLHAAIPAMLVRYGIVAALWLIVLRVFSPHQAIISLRSLPFGLTRVVEAYGVMLALAAGIGAIGGWWNGTMPSLFFLVGSTCTLLLIHTAARCGYLLYQKHAETLPTQEQGLWQQLLTLPKPVKLLSSLTVESPQSSVLFAAHRPETMRQYVNATTLAAVNEGSYESLAQQPEHRGLRLADFALLNQLALTQPQRFVKRLFDLIISTCLLIILSPLLLLIALVIKFDSAGPVLFCQQRIGENGTLFRMIKFRSMCSDAEERWQEVAQRDAYGRLIHKTDTDPRITRLGRLLRRTSVDELPQLINVLRGEMSLVGPRPEMPYMLPEYQPWQMERFCVPPGLTGWWQVNGRSDRLMHLHTEDDLYYIKHYSFWLDLKILWLTIGVVTHSHGAY